MSSIFGKCSIDKNPVSPGDLKLMQDELGYWQADDANVWVRDYVAMGHLMLYNTPESLHEKLPLHDNLYELAITADARIDNRDELYTLLQLNTSGEKDLPDSNIILKLYKKYGADCVKYLIGDFVFAIWDEKEQKLFCARDHMGVKPFFYSKNDRFFAFASEKKGLLCLPGFDKTIDKQFFYNQVFEPVVQAENTTLYQHIRRLPPAHSLTLYPATNKLQLLRYWTLDAYSELKLPKKEEYYEGLRAHFETAVKCRLRSYFPVGTELSGGMDSSAITGVASAFLKREGKNIITFSNVDNGDETIYKDVPGENERQYVEEVIRFNNIEEYVLVMEDIWDDPIDEIDFSLKINDGLEKQSVLWQIPIKTAARQKNVRTLLSGFPGDEMVTYRGQFYFLDYLDKKQYSKYFFAKSQRPFNRLKPFVPASVEFFMHKIKNLQILNSQRSRRIADFFKIPLRYRYTKSDVVWEDENYRERYESYRHYQKYRLLKPQVPLRMEAETRFGMGFKIEPRYPMADIRLTQFYLSMPNEIKYEGGICRNAYRIAVKQYLPEILWTRDSKFGNIAPFKITPNAINGKKDAMLKIINTFEDKSIYGEIITAQNKKNKYNQVAFLELLRWFEKNFGNL